MYQAELPVNPGDGGNVTYTVSSNVPARLVQTTRVIPPAVETKQSPDLVIPRGVRRRALGELAFSISRTKPSQIQSGTKQHEVGQVLEFVDEVTLDVQPMLVNDIEIRHDTNKLDLIRASLTEVEAAALISASESKFTSKTAQLNQLKQERADIEVGITENKKSQNEIDKILLAVGDIESADVIVLSAVAKLRARLEVLEAEERSLITRANEVATESDLIMTQLRDSAQMVR